jgi:YVTN family beta-propeller protein
LADQPSYHVVRMWRAARLFLGGSLALATLLTGCTSTEPPPFHLIPFGGRGVDEIELSHPVATVDITKRFVWVLESAVNQRWFLEKVDPRSLEVVGRPLRAGSPLVSDMAISGGSAWLSMPTLTGPSWDEEPGIVRRIDLDTGKITAEIQVGHHPGGIVWCGGSVWVSNTVDRSVMRIDPARNRVVATIGVGDGPDELVCGFEGVWVSNRFHRPVLMRIDPSRDRVVARFPDLIRPVVGDEVLWTIGPGGPEGAVVPIDPKTNEIEDSIAPLDIGPGYVAAGQGTMWLGKWYDEPSPPPCPPDADCPFFGTFEFFRLNPTTGETFGDRIVTNGPTTAVVGAGAFWAPIQGMKLLLHKPLG